MIDRASLDCIAKNSSCSCSLGRRFFSGIPRFAIPFSAIPRLVVETLSRLVDLAVPHTITSTHPTETSTNVILAACRQSITRAVLSLVDQSALANRLYNAFLMSNDPVDQKVAHGFPTQTVNHVFTC